MGQSESKPAVQPKKNMYIRPAPGYRGVKVVKRNRLHFYDPTNSQIHILSTYPNMTLNQLKTKLCETLDFQNFDIYDGTRRLPIRETIHDLGITERNILRIQYLSDEDLVSESTEDGASEFKLQSIGPRRFNQIPAMTQKLSPESVINSEVIESFEDAKRPLWGVKLEKYAVSDDFQL